MQMIADGKIKEGTEIGVIYGITKPIYVFENDTLIDKEIRTEMGVSVLFSDHDFEILEDTTEEIEEVHFMLDDSSYANNIIDMRNKLNQVIRAVNKLNNTTYKAENCMTD